MEDNATPLPGRQQGAFRRGFAACVGLRRRVALRNAFSMLEVLIAVAILALVGLSIYRFLETNIRAITYATEDLDDDREMEGLIAALESQIKSLPIARPNALLGQAFKFGGTSADEMTWTTSAGSGLFTAHAASEYDVTLALLPVKGMEGHQLGIRRELADKSSDAVNWVPLINNVEALEIRYYDLRLEDWLEKWTDPNVRPAVVRIRIWRLGEKDPYEAIIRLPATRKALE